MTFSLEFFLPLVDTAFTFDTQAGPIELKLTEAKEYPRNNLPEQFRTPLSLIFSGPLDLILAQDNYYVNHPAMERQVWMMAPVAGMARPYLSAIPAPQQTMQRYQVLFG